MRKRLGKYFNAVTCPQTGKLPDDLAELNIRRSAFYAYLNTLTPKLACIIRLRLLGLSHAEIAAELSIPIGTSRWRLHAAMCQLCAHFHIHSKD